jgi:hypothetical protein
MSSFHQKKQSKTLYVRDIQNQSIVKKIKIVAVKQYVLNDMFKFVICVVFFATYVFVIVIVAFFVDDVVFYDAMMLYNLQKVIMVIMYVFYSFDDV